MVQSLTEREKETLRLLVAGHDAKSIARTLDLSIHTVNERLRDARRKLSVSSSREAARILAAAERLDPNFLGDKPIGVAPSTASDQSRKHSKARPWTSHPLVWVGGGMLIMAVIVAALAASSLWLAAGAPQTGSAPAPAAPEAVQETPETRAARDWLGLIDKGSSDVSWDAAGNAFKSIPKERWETMAGDVRRPLGQVSSRALQSVTRANALPGAPPGDYVVIQFKSTYALREVVETVVLSRETAGWKVNGYFIR